jgi:hypothetical protein
MSIPGGFIAISESFMKACNYINIKNEHPKVFAIICHDNLVFKKEELNDKNWLYIGEESEEKNKGQLEYMKFRKGVIPIFE